MNILFVGMGGFTGAVCRYLLGEIIHFKNIKFPFVTLGINLLGSLIIGFLAFSVATSIEISPKWMLFLKVGMCGGFTTFSTFSLETFSLLEKGQWLLAIIYAISSVTFCLLGVLLGKMLVAMLFGVN